MILTPSPVLLLWKLLLFVVFALFTGVTTNSLFLSYNSVMLNVTHTHTYTHMHAHTHTLFPFSGPPRCPVGLGPMTSILKQCKFLCVDFSHVKHIAGVNNI